MGGQRTVSIVTVMFTLSLIEHNYILANTFIITIYVCSYIIYHEAASWLMEGHTTGIVRRRKPCRLAVSVQPWQSRR